MKKIDYLLKKMATVSDQVVAGTIKELKIRAGYHIPGVDFNINNTWSIEKANLAEYPEFYQSFIKGLAAVKENIDITEADVNHGSVKIVYNNDITERIEFPPVDII